VLITGIRALPPTRRKQRNAEIIFVQLRGSPGGKREHDQQHGEKICAQMRMWKKIWMKKERQHHLGGQWLN